MPGRFDPFPLHAVTKEGTMSLNQEVEFVGETIPPRIFRKPWANRLLPLLERPGVWALVHTAKNPREANKIQSNLTQRQVHIPEPDHVWQFAARGCIVYAVYRGRKRGSRK
jgi:hypothetical protein